MSTLYIKVLKDDTIIAVEAHPSPVYVYKQENGVLVRCTQRKAQGILSIDGSTVYQLFEKTPLGNATLTAMVITTTEYQQLVDTLDEPPEAGGESGGETENPGGEETPVMTTAEMRQRILTLEEELAATKVLLGVE